jgi:hypothetical protein
MSFLGSLAGEEADGRYQEERKGRANGMRPTKFSIRLP